MGDFNAHHRLWNCPDTDENGERLLEETEEKELYIINIHTLSRQGNINQRNTNLDLVIGSLEMVYKLNCYQLDDTWGSHHYPIETILDETVSTYKKRTNRLSTKKTDWVKYKNILQQKDENIKNLQINEDSWKVIYEKLANELKRTVTLATRGTSVKKNN